MKLIRERLGERSRVMTEHQTQILIGNDATGDWGKDSAMSDIEHIVMTVQEYDPKWRAVRRDGAGAGPGKSSGGDVYGFKDTPGQSLFIKLCSSCHTVGRGDRVGPDLSGVTSRRDPAWLRKFIVNAENMRRAGDPEAIALFEKYNRVQMPNLGLVDVDAADVIAYIERETVRLKEARAKPAPDSKTTPQ
jgi:protein SCO1